MELDIPNLADELAKLASIKGVAPSQLQTIFNLARRVVNERLELTYIRNHIRGQMARKEHGRYILNHEFGMGLLEVLEKCSEDEFVELMRHISMLHDWYSMWFRVEPFFRQEERIKQVLNYLPQTREVVQKVKLTVESGKPKLVIYTTRHVSYSIIKSELERNIPKLREINYKIEIKS